MAIVEKKDGKTYWVESDGTLCPLKRVSAEEKKKDKTIENLFLKAESYQKEGIEFKNMVRTLMKKYLDDLASKHGEKWKGNATIYNFSGDKAISVEVAKAIAFNENIKIAKSKIDRYIETLTKNANKDLVNIVNSAFSVNKSNQLDVKQILRLRKQKIDHPYFKEAMELIDEAIFIKSSKTYYNFRKKDEKGDLKLMVLNYSKL